MLSLSTASLYAGESWGASLFSVKRHDFGRVAIGVDAEYRFVFENNYVEDIKVLSVQSSCGCTSVQVTKENLKSTEQAAVVAKLNTSGQHTYEKSATITVRLETVVHGKSTQDTVQLFVTGYIRPDVVLTPGIVEFGSTAEGRSVARTIQLEYAGREDWALTKIERTHPFIHARAEQIKNNRGEVVYQITVTLKDNAPVGYVKDALRLTTNERRIGLGEPVGIVLPIHGVVTAPILAKPSPFMAGLIATGENVAKNIVVRSDTPFRIREVLCDDKRFRFTYAEQQSNIQIISVLFSATGPETDEPIDLVDSIRIRTDLPDQEYVVLEAMARIVPAQKIDTLPSTPVKHSPNDVNVLEAEKSSPEPLPQWNALSTTKEEKESDWTGITSHEEPIIVSPIPNQESVAQVVPSMRTERTHPDSVEKEAMGPVIRAKFGTPKFGSVPAHKTSLVPRQME